MMIENLDKLQELLENMVDDLDGNSVAKTIGADETTVTLFVDNTAIGFKVGDYSEPFFSAETDGVTTDIYPIHLLRGQDKTEFVKWMKVLHRKTLDKHAENLGDLFGSIT